MKRRQFIQLSGLAAAAPVAARTAEAPPAPDTLREPERDIPVTEEADVIVCGAGPAGLAAALAAARKGAKTVLLEVHGCLGGVWTAGSLCWMLDHDNKDGIMDELKEELSMRGARGVDRKGRLTNAFDVEEMKVLLEELCTEAGIRIQYFTRVASAVRDAQNTLTHVITESKSGREAMKARVFVDCTGDGDVAARAGCGFDIGHPETGATQPFSMLCLLTGIHVHEVKDYYRIEGESWAAPKLRLKAQMEQGGHSPSYAKPSLFPIRDDFFLMMANHEYGFSAIDARDVTEATLRARREINQLVDGLRSLRGPWKDIRVVATGAQIGTREGRRIHGVYKVSDEDLRVGARHKDAVCRVTFPIDVHSTDPKKNKDIEAKPFKSKPYDIPLRALIAKDVDGLMMAGRCISGDFIAHSSYRVTGNAVALGEAAGRTAAVAALGKRRPNDVEFSEIAG